MTVKSTQDTQPSRTLSTSPRKNLHAPIYNHRIVLTTYPGQLGVNPIPLNWGNADPKKRGPILSSRLPSNLKMRNAIGALGGSYSIYRALAIAIGELSPAHKPDLKNTTPPVDIGKSLYRFSLSLHYLLLHDFRTTI